MIGAFDGAFLEIDIARCQRGFGVAAGVSGRIEAVIEPINSNRWLQIESDRFAGLEVGDFTDAFVSASRRSSVGLIQILSGGWGSADSQLH